MLKQIRENARIPLYLLIIAFIGMYAISSRDTNTAAGKIFGKKVTLSDFQKAYVGARTQIIMRYGELPRDEKLNSVLKEEAWNRIMLLEEAKKERIRAGDKDVVDFVKSISAFNDKNGRFSKSQYEEILKYNFGLTPKEFETQVRENLVIDKLIDSHSQAAKISDEDVLKEYKFLNEKAKAEYALFKSADFLQQVSASDDEISSYFEKNKDSFKVPEKVNVEYIMKPFADDKEESKDKTRREMKDISYEFASSSDLAAAAKKFSLDIKETGFFDRESNIPGIGYDLKFADAALVLQPDKVSDPIETKGGICIIKVKGKKPARPAELSEVKDSIAAILKAGKADAIAKEKAETALKSSKNGQGLSFKKTDAFARGQYVEGIGVSPEFADAAFSAKQGEIYDGVVKVHDGYALVKQDSVIPIDDKKYQEEKDKLKQMMETRRKYFASITWFTELRKRANIEDDLDNMRGRKK